MPHFNYRFNHQINYINWYKESEFINIEQEEMREMLAEYKTKKRKLKYKTIRKQWNKDTYFLEKKNNWMYLYTFDGEKYFTFTCNWFDNHKNKHVIEHVGPDAIKALHDRFKRNTGMTFLKAFGYVEEEYKKCIPKQFVWRNEKKLGKKLFHLSSIDGCAQYPSNMCGLLPDSHTAVTFEGTIEPNEEFPFAFYLKSGHVAEYQVFDTHNWLDNKFNFALFDPKRFSLVERNEDVTVLMKASKYNLSSTYEYFYEIRKRDEQAKMVMNASIGMMHTKKYKSYKLAHCVAIALARANQSILNKIEEIGARNIVHICVDGIMYIGTNIYGEAYSKLGRFKQEYVDCEGIIINNNAYIIKKNDAIIKVKHGSYNTNFDGTVIHDDEITDLEEVFNWQKAVPLEED